ncbi:hypothetical protein SAMN05660653_02185 [Desulfonatronum thiosulfatophilum]|uniref:Toxin-antitoxin system protein n=1 Tax=Desulfonatronum thiosulfatophilum TaxID=617002 RepID=A0A1G6DIY4_9BACT|nr:hypothetical protein [Desulfonatronum thiosulfatophilum]SDB45102.1 hypothetical protein SAMN05660653_02185 [Desulfonatronum thiosulfatophilum]
MQTTTIRISTNSHVLLKQIAKDEAEPMQAVLERLLRKYRAEQLLQRTNEAFAELRGNPEGWADEQQEREIWGKTLADDLQDDMETK